MRRKKNNFRKKFRYIFLLIALVSIIAFCKINNNKKPMSVSLASLQGNSSDLVSGEELNRSSQEKVVTPEDEIIYLSDIDYTDIGNDKSFTGWGNIQRDKNPDEKTIQLRKDGEVVAYSKGMGLHATGQIIYDISKYSDIHTRFVTFMGVDSSKPDTGSIQITISVSDDGNTWENVVAQTEVLHSKDECKNVDVSVSGKKYLKIRVDNGGNGISADHCVLAEAKLVKQDYNENSNLYDKIKKLEEYDKTISATQDIETSMTNNYKLILDREFVRKFGYWSIQNFVKSSDINKNVIDWILSDQEVLEKVIEVGEISDGRLFFEVLGNLYEKYGDLLKGEDKEVYQKMMIGLSAAYSTDYMAMATSFGMQKPSYDYIERFEIMKNLLNGYTVGGVKYQFENPEQFKKLHVDLIRNVMNIGLRNEEIVWLNYHSTTKTESNKFNCHAYMSYRTPVYKDEYFDSSYESIYDGKYNLLKFNIPFADGRTTREWMIIDNGGVCWNISRVGQAVHKVNGIPAVGLYQPAHEPFLRYREDENGNGIWEMLYNVGGWGKAGTTWGGGSRYRLLFDWANKYFTDQNIGGSKGGTSSGYAILAQANLNDYENYKKSLYYNLLANSYSEFDKKEEIYKKALSIEKLNLDSYDLLINLYKENLTDKDVEDGTRWCDLAESIIKNYTYYPNAMYDLIQVIRPYIEEISESEEEISSREYFIDTGFSQALTNASMAGPGVSIQYEEVKSLAGRYTNNKEVVATFSFSGEYANQIILNDQYKINYQYSVDYDGDPDNCTWSELSTEKYRTLTDEELKKINSENDIVIKMTGTNNLETIDIVKPMCDEIPVYKDVYFNFLNCYNNDLENKLFEANESFEWCYLDSDGNPTEKNEEGETIWKSFTNNPPDLEGNHKIRVRLGRGGTTLESQTYQDYEFTENEEDSTRKYIPISEVRFKSGTEGAENVHGDYAINGNYLKSVAVSNLKEKSGDNYFIYEFAYPMVLSSVEYIPDCEKYGQMLSGQILGSMDGNTWTELASLRDIEYDASKEKDIPCSFEGCTTYGLDNIKTFEIPSENRIKVRYVKIVSTSSVPNKNGNNIFSARMFNFYEDTEKQIVEEKTNPTADVEFDIPKQTCKPVTATIVSRSSKDVVITNDDDGDGNPFEHTFTENGTYTFKLKDDEGRTGEAVATVNWIDKEAETPDVEFSTESPTNGEVEVVLKPKEDIVVLNINSNFRINDRNCLEYVIRNEDGKETNHIVLKDFDQDKLYKNTIDKDFSLDENGNILNENGEIVVENNSTKIDYDEKTGEEIKVEDKNTLYKYTFFDNGEFTFEFVDRFGNHGTKTVEVNWIDNTTPTGMITYDVTHKTDGKVNATISFDEEDVEITNNNGNETYTFNKNGEFVFTFVDKGGNIGETIAKVDWIEKDLNSEEYDVENDSVENVSPNTKLEDFKNNLSSTYEITIKDKAGNILGNDAIIGTGTRVEVNSKTYVVVVTGDVDGDGKILDSDVSKLCKYYVGKESLEGEYFKAGDIDNNTEITLKDVSNVQLLSSGKVSKINNNVKLNVQNSTVKSGEEVIGYVQTSGLTSEINAISGELEYNSSNLELLKVELDNNNWKFEENNGKFILVRNTLSKENENLLKLTFKSVEGVEGTIPVTLANAKISNGEIEEIIDNNSINIKIENDGSESENQGEQGGTTEETPGGNIGNQGEGEEKPEGSTGDLDQSQGEVPSGESDKKLEESKNNNSKNTNTGNSKDPVPGTSDMSIELFVTLMIVSFIGIVVIICRKRHQNI